MKTSEAKAPASYKQAAAKIASLLRVNSLDVSTAQRFQRAYPRDAFANFALGVATWDKNDLGSLPYFQFAVRSDFNPVYVDALVAAYLKLDFFEEASALSQEAERRFPKTATVAANVADVHMKLNRIDEAIRQYDRAIELAADTSYTLKIRKIQVRMLIAANRYTEAEALLKELEQDSTSRAFVVARRIEMAKYDLESPIAAEIRELLDGNSSDDRETGRPNLLRLYGLLAENSRDYDLAFDSWKKSRAKLQDLYDPHLLEEEFLRIRRVFTKDVFAKTRPFSHNSRAYIFIVGMPRSGTTLLDRILSSHQKCKSVGELGRLYHYNNTLIRVFGNQEAANGLFQEVLKGRFRDRAAEALRLAEIVAGSPSEFYVDKMPLQFMAAGCIHACLPNAKFINIIRHPADIFISTYQNDFNDFWIYSYAFSQAAFAHFYLQREKLMEYWRSLFGDQILDVRYEELVADPEPQVRRILEFLDLEWDSSVLKFHEEKAVVKTFSRDQVRSPINTRSVGRWRNYEKHLGPLFKTLSDLGFSYPEANTMSSTPQ